MVDKVNQYLTMPDVEIARLIDRLMRRINAGLNADAPQFDRHRLGPGGGIALLSLAEIEPARSQDLVHRMARDKSQMARTLQSLEKKGLIVRAPDPDDARAALLSLTEEGRRTVRELENAVAHVLEGVLAPFSPEERAAFKALLDRL